MKRHQEMLSLKGEIEQYKMQIKSHFCAMLGKWSIISTKNIGRQEIFQ